MRIEIEQEEDGRWLTEIPELPGVMVYGSTRDEALSRVKALALRVLADRLEHGEPVRNWWRSSRSRHEPVGNQKGKVGAGGPASSRLAD
jgi:predicted RNase H-like HicB family nuclease